MEQQILAWAIVFVLSLVAVRNFIVISEYRRSTKKLSKQVDDLETKNFSLEKIKMSLKELCVKLEASQNTYCDKWEAAEQELSKYKGKRGSDGKFIKKNQ
jgi:signal transduction histidine kinase